MNGIQRSTNARPRGRAVQLIVVVALVASAFAACGGNDDSAGSADADRAFLEAMIPHHTSAIEMARIARRRAEHPQVADLARAIVRTQTREIRQIRAMYQRIFGERALPNADAHETLGLSAADAGMAHMDSGATLKRADPFDKAFIDAMVPHHQGAIRMAHAVMADTQYAGVRDLADAIVGAQSREIREMNRWRRQWYGAPSPAGGVPSGADAMGGGGAHEGH